MELKVKLKTFLKIVIYLLGNKDLRNYQFETMPKKQKREFNSETFEEDGSGSGDHDTHVDEDSSEFFFDSVLLKDKVVPSTQQDLDKSPHVFKDILDEIFQSLLEKDQTLTKTLSDFIDQESGFTIDYINFKVLVKVHTVEYEPNDIVKSFSNMMERDLSIRTQRMLRLKVS